MGLKPLEDLLARVGGWPVLQGDKWDSTGFDAWDMSVKLLKLGYSNDYIASTWVYTDLKNNSHRSSLPLPSTVHYLTARWQRRLAYFYFVFSNFKVNLAPLSLSYL